MWDGGSHSSRNENPRTDRDEGADNAIELCDNKKDNFKCYDNNNNKCAGTGKCRVKALHDNTKANTSSGYNRLQPARRRRRRGKSRIRSS